MVYPLVVCFGDCSHTDERLVISSLTHEVTASKHYLTSRDQPPATRYHTGGAHWRRSHLSVPKDRKLSEPGLHSGEESHYWYGGPAGHKKHPRRILINLATRPERINTRVLV